MGEIYHNFNFYDSNQPNVIMAILKKYSDNQRSKKIKETRELSKDVIIEIIILQPQFCSSQEK